MEWQCGRQERGSREPDRLPRARLPATCPLARPPGSATHARRVGQLDLELTAIEVVAIEPLDGLVSLVGRSHLDETESARSTGVPIHDDGSGFHGADLGKEIAETFRGRGEGETADE